VANFLRYEKKMEFWVAKKEKKGVALQKNRRGKKVWKGLRTLGVEVETEDTKKGERGGNFCSSWACGDAEGGKIKDKFKLREETKKKRPGP